MMNPKEDGGTTDTTILPAHHRLRRGSVLQRPQQQRHLSQQRDRTLVEDDKDNGTSPKSETVEGMQEEDSQQEVNAGRDNPIEEEDNKPNKDALDPQDDEELVDAAAGVSEEVEEPVVVNGEQRLSYEQDLPSIHVQGVEESEPPVDNLEDNSGVAKEDDEMLEQPPRVNPSTVVDTPPPTGNPDRTEDLEGSGETQSIPQGHGVGSPTYDSEDQIQNVEMYSLSDLNFDETDSSSTDLLDYEDVDDIRFSFASSEEHIDVMNQYMGGESNIFDPEYYNTIAKTEIDNDARMFEAEDVTTGMNVSILLVLGVLVLYFFLITTKRVGIQNEQRRGGAGYQPLEPGKTA
jgi:hypothetical protein